MSHPWIPTSPCGDHCLDREDAPVRPIALRFRLAGRQETTSPAFIGTETLGSSAWRVARLRGLIVEVFCCAEIAPGRAANRRELAALAQSMVRSALGETVHVPSPTLVAPDTAQRRARTASG